MIAFKNKKTGNIIRTDNEVTIALMEKSPNYSAVVSKGDKTADKSAENKKSE